jgi:hypothetical protein
MWVIKFNAGVQTCHSENWSSKTVMMCNIGQQNFPTKCAVPDEISETHETRKGSV